MDVSEVRTGFTQHRDEVGVQVQQQFQHFLEEFQEDGEIKYLAPIVELTGMGRDSLEVSMRDIEKFNNTLNDTIIEEYYRVAPFLNQALSNVVKDRAPEKINKEVYVNLIDVVEEVSLRQLRSSKVGSLVRIKGQVVRTYPVHPELIRGTFICQDCQTVIKEVEQEFKFTYPVICRNPVCNNRRRFELDNEKSVFVDFQKLKIQEMQEEMPRGSIPKSFDIIVRAEIVETVQAGDRYYFSGTLIVIPDVANIALPGVRAEPSSRHKTGDNVTDGVRGLKSLGVRDLNYRFAFLACSIVPTHPRLFGTEIPGELSAEIIKQQMSDEEWQEVYKMSRDKNLFNNLINSLFPNIYGNDQVKKGILLMLFGGVSKKTVGGNTLRGDINCLIVGDPSTAKSQFLKQVAKFVPRSVYTSGKASTAAGLTAAVVRDEESADFVIEAGALLLADNGICCIDEFDKMDTRDQVAIHEAMEQQTISLAKAGVRASLNARTSILAAANPVSGRYDRTKSLQQNVNLSAPIMSRFDLFFVILDECNEVTDCAIADRILRSRRNYLKGKSNYGDGATVYSKKMILNYIIFAKQFKPLITPEAKEKLVDYYDEMRQRDSQNTKNCWRTTVRQLESMIRLSEAMARMACSDFVTVKHVDESYQLLKKSIIRIEQPDINLDGDTPDAPLQAIIEEDEEAVDDPPQSQPAVGVQKNTLSFDEYKRLTNSLVIFIRKEDTKRTEAAEAGVSPYEGVRKSEVVDEYLSWMGDEIESEDDLRTKKSFIEKVIDRLINHDQILIPLDPPGPPRIDDEGEEEERDPIIIVHPSYLTDL